MLVFNLPCASISAGTNSVPFQPYNMETFVVPAAFTLNAAMTIINARISCSSSFLVFNFILVKFIYSIHILLVEEQALTNPAHEAVSRFDGSTYSPFLCLVLCQLSGLVCIQ